MALKKSDENLTAAEQELKRAEEAKAQEEQRIKDEAEAKAKQEEADKVEQKRLDDLAAENKAREEAAGKESAAKEEKRLADKKIQDDKEAESERERLAQEAEVAKAAGREPTELVLVLVESKTFSDLRQPSSGKWIPGKGEAHLLHDGWLENQIASGLMKIVKNK